MASPTKRHKVRKALTKARAGKKRKSHERNHGSTAPNLALDKPNENELAQAKAKA